jgi:tetratricopeptide (TPR) repeat protein
MTPKTLLIGLALAGASSLALAADKGVDQTIKSLEARIVELNGRGHYEEAVPLAKQVIELRRKKDGPEDRDYASALANLAMLDKSLGRYDEAQPLLEQSLAVRQKILKPSDPLISASLGSLAEIYGDEGKPEQAEPLLKQLQGKASLEIANGEAAVGFAYLTQKRFEEAIPPLQQALDAYRKLYPANHPKTAATTANLATAYVGAGKPDLAEPLLKQAAQPITGDDQGSVEALTRQSDFYMAQNRPDDAAPVLKRVLEIRRKLGNEDKNLAARIGNLAAAYANSGRYEDAVPLWRENIALFEKIGGPESVPAAGGLDNLAIVYLNQSDLDNAEPLLTRSAAIYLKALGEASPQYLKAQERLDDITHRRKVIERQQQEKGTVH